MVQAPISVLLADDTTDIRMLLRVSFEIDGRFEVVGEARDGREAVSLALAKLPDVVLLDLAMPVMDGLQAIQPIVSGSPGSKIVVLSGFDAAEMATEAIDRGAHAYLEKGVSGPQVIETVLDVLGPLAPAAPVISPPPIAAAEPRRAEEPRGPEEEASEVLAALVHELLTPLTVIQGFSDTITQRIDVLSSDMIAEAATSISRNAEQMAHLITSFADARRMEVDELDLYLERVDLGDFVRQTVRDLAHLTADRAVGLDLLPRMEVKIDRTKVRQVLHNLVTNAVRYTPAGSPIDIGMVRTASEAEVWIGDHGPGIPSANAETVFSKFTSLAGSGKGPGLGLYIARSIARAHGGDVTLTAQASGGARFTLRLPARN
jgi:signal transduction histidine kinase